MHTDIAATSQILTPLLTRRDECETIRTFGTDNRILLSSEQSGGASTVFLLQAPRDSGPPLHVHTLEDEMFYVLGGRFEFSLQGDSVERGAGEFVFLPRNVPHTWKALTDGAEALVIATPGGFEKFLRESSTVELSQPDGFERVTAIVEKFGMRWV